MTRISKIGLGDRDEDDWASRSIEERLAAVWELTRVAYEFKLGGPVEDRMLRNVAWVARVRRNCEMKLFHATGSDASTEIMRHGFVDRGYRLVQDGCRIQGVVLFDDPLAAASGAPVDGVLLEVSLPKPNNDIAEYIVAKPTDPRGYSIYCIPSAILNTRGMTHAIEYVDIVKARESELNFPEIVKPESQA